MRVTSAPTLAGQRVLVTGSTGTVGLPVTLALARTNEVVAVARFSDERARAALEAAGVRCVVHDLEDDDLSGVPVDVEFVVNFARPAERPTPDFDAAVRGHAESIGLLMAHCRGARAVLHCSSTSIYRRGEAPRREEDPLGDDAHVARPTYSIGKICAEAVVRTAARVLGLPTTIARLNVPYGDNGGWPATHLAAVVAGRPVVVHERSPSRFNPIHTDDIVRTIGPLLGAASVPATVVNWAGTEIVSVEEWTEFLAGLVGREARLEHSPDATESVTIDTGKLVDLAGPMTVEWRSGMERMARARFPAEVR